MMALSQYPMILALKNIVICDSLPFLHQGDGEYQYLDDAVFPLDNREFSNEGRDRNFFYTMEMHTVFTKTPKLMFTFSGDDDVWCFINGELSMDLGGIHQAANGSFMTVDIPGLVN